MKLNTVIELLDGRIGTICYHHLDGYGGVWGRYTFEMPAGGFGDELPAPEFMLREEAVGPSLRRGDHGHDHRPDMECVGETFTIVEDVETP